MSATCHLLHTQRNRPRSRPSIEPREPSCTLLTKALCGVRTLERPANVLALNPDPAALELQDQQKVVTKAIMASTLVNVGTVLSTSAAQTAMLRVATKLSFIGATALGFMTLVALLKIKQAEKKELAITGAA